MSIQSVPLYEGHPNLPAPRDVTTWPELIRPGGLGVGGGGEGGVPLCGCIGSVSTLIYVKSTGWL